ncbi:MAG: type I DNA topoisomerase [Candidatus Sericytochromatia bacterium]|nr:type I DNA topoisomerase [Candidatus Tanganyikabacteria bacterium]
MAKNLVIVESPAKAKTIGKILGKDFTVKASAGHVRDLPKKGLGVDVKKRFAPQYVVLEEKEKVVKDLQDAAEDAKEIYLAPDPDREGEAIAWHLSTLLAAAKKPVRRIEFNEITKDAILRAVKNPRDIDMQRVNAQQARRVLDRLVGYKISPLLWQKVKRGLSAGRVQSVAVRLICDREKEIQAFVAQEYWTISAELLKEKFAFVADLAKWQGKKPEITGEQEAMRIKDALAKATYKVAKLQTRESKRRPSAPFTTSSLQQECSRRFGFTVKRTMALAQQLYEGMEIGEEGAVGLITYMRTDSVRVAAEAQEEAEKFIVARFGKEYKPEERRVYASKKGAQEAHEAIRPTSILRTPDQLKKQLTPDQAKLYKVVWERFCASQMADARLSVTSVEIAAAEGVFRASDTLVVFPGYQAAYQETAEEDAAEEEKQVKLPPLKEGEVLGLKQLLPKQHFTQAPPRFTEATLVRTLEELGIGRPSTYAPTIATVQERGYVERDAKALKPTDLGLAVNDQLVSHFPDIVDVAFTSRMEQNLDDIEDGGQQWEVLIEGFYGPFQQTLKKAEQEMQAIALPSGESCVNCGKQMMIRSGRFGDYLACEDYPTCKTTKPIVKKLDMKCKKDSCEGEIVIKRTRTGKTFYGCNKYPECNWTSWDEPTMHLCQKCNTYMVKKFSRAKGRPFLLCSNQECKHIQNMPSQKKAKEGEEPAEELAEA